MTYTPKPGLPRWIGWTNTNARRRGHAPIPRDAAWPVGPCHYCGGEQTGWDHVVPLALGGEHTIANLVPCCKPCNGRKRNHPPEYLNNPQILHLLCGWCWKPIERAFADLRHQRYVSCPEHRNRIRWGALPFGTEAAMRTRKDGRKGYVVVL